MERNARNREKYANDPEYRQRRIQIVAKHVATKRPDHIQKYLNDPEYREAIKEYEKWRNKRRDAEAKIRWDAMNRKENRNNVHQKNLLGSWLLRNKFWQRLVWETHDPLVTEGDGLPALCASCGGCFTRRLWWRRKIAEKTGEQLLDCHNCFCDKDWEKALPLGYRGHVFGSRIRLKEPGWANYPPSASSP